MNRLSASQRLSSNAERVRMLWLERSLLKILYSVRVKIRASPSRLACNRDLSRVMPLREMTESAVFRPRSKARMRLSNSCIRKGREAERDGTHCGDRSAGRADRKRD